MTIAGLSSGEMRVSRLGMVLGVLRAPTMELVGVRTAMALLFTEVLRAFRLAVGMVKIDYRQK
jgi:hypothetical protein